MPLPPPPRRVIEITRKDNEYAGRFVPFRKTEADPKNRSLLADQSQRGFLVAACSGALTADLGAFAQY